MSNTASALRTTKAGLVFVSAALACASLWDFRLHDVRVFDGAALGCLIFFLALTPEARDGFLRRRRDYWLLFALIAIYATAGYLIHARHSSLAILVLGTVGFILVGRRDWPLSRGALLWAIVGAHILFFLVQFLAFYGFRLVIDFQALAGGASRIMRSPEHMRAAGLFQEPNSYSLNLFVITTMAILSRPSRPFTLAAGVTMFFSESFWGIGASIVLLFLNELLLQRSPRRLFTAFGATVAVAAIAFNAYLWLAKSPNESIPFSYLRVMELLKDPSLRERYLHNTCAFAPAAYGASSSTATQTTRLLLGEGLSTHFFTQCLPVNGFAFLFKSLGIIGLAALLAGFARALRGLPAGAKLYAALAVGFSFTSYPLMTYVIFWMWLPAVFGLLRARQAP